MKKILVIQNKRIGDVLIASVLANNLKKHFPESLIHYFVYDYTAGVLEGNPNIDQIVTVQDRELKKLPVLWKTIQQVKREQYDIILDPYAKFQSRMLCYFSQASIRVGFKRQNKKLRLSYYTHEVEFLNEGHMPCGKALEDRMHMLTSAFGIKDPDPMYRIFLSEEEKNYSRIAHLERPVVMIGILGSTRNKSLPFRYTAELIDFIAENYQATLLFNYAPNQKAEAKEIYDLCQCKEQVHWDIYEDSIRGFIKLMNQCELLISNEGGSVHIAKALQKPTFTIYSPFISKSHWNSFEDGKTHDSVHLFDKNPEGFNQLSRDEKKAIEKNPEILYNQLTPTLIKEKLIPYLDYHLKS